MWIPRGTTCHGGLHTNISVAFNLNLREYEVERRRNTKRRLRPRSKGNKRSSPFVAFLFSHYQPHKMAELSEFTQLHVNNILAFALWIRVRVLNQNSAYKVLSQKGHKSFRSSLSFPYLTHVIAPANKQCLLFSLHFGTHERKTHDREYWWRWRQLN